MLAGNLHQEEVAALRAMEMMLERIDLVYNHDELHAFHTVWKEPNGRSIEIGY